MNQVIYKYALEIKDGEQEFVLPEDFVVLDAQIQEGQLYMWLVHDTTNVKYAYKFVVLGTGQPFTYQSLVHVGTVQQGPFVWHVFYIAQ